MIGKSYNTIRFFTDLIVWQEGHKLVIEIYNMTKKFPKSELFSLIDQMRRSAASITSNIAEGFSRQTYKEKIQFYYHSMGSLSELENQTLIARDVGYVDKIRVEELSKRFIFIGKLLQSLIKKSRNYVS